MKFWNFVKKHKVLFICAIVFGLAGFWGLLCGLATGYFCEKILSQKNDNEKLVEILQNSFDNQETILEEPFNGALLVCAIAVNLAGTTINAANQLKFTFNKKYDFDWLNYCNIALKAQNKNNDILTECLAAKLKNNKDSQCIELVFQLFDSLEYGWDYRIGNPPSVYLSELLNCDHISDEKINAYRILGVTPEDKEQTIKNAYRQLARQYHPDTLKGLSEEQKVIAQEAFLRIQKAYEFICSQ